MENVKIIKVVPKLWAAKAIALGGFGYGCYKFGKLCQKLIDRINFEDSHIIDFSKEKETH